MPQLDQPMPPPVPLKRGPQEEKQKSDERNTCRIHASWPHPSCGTYLAHIHRERQQLGYPVVPVLALEKGDGISVRSSIFSLLV
ncbi:MAG: hypothetical protein ABFD69_04000 [Candidatus Sumerlaeia bacterium]